MAHFKIPCDGWIVHSIPFILSLTAFLLSVVAGRSCRFLSSQNELNGVSFWGIFQYEAGGQDNAQPCVNFNYRAWRYRQAEGGLPESVAASEDDFHIAQIGAVVAMSAGAVVTLLLFASFFRVLPPWMFKLCSVLLLAAVAGCGTTFRLFEIYWCGDGTFFDNDAGMDREVNGRCFMEGGGSQMAAAMGIYLWTAIVVLLMETPGTTMVEFTRYEIISSTEVELPKIRTSRVAELERTRQGLEDEAQMERTQDVPITTERLY